MINIRYLNVWSPCLSYCFSIYRLVVQAYGNVSMTDEEAEEMIMSADGDGNGEVIIEISC